VESFQSLFLKAHYPLEYMVATINNGGGFYSREFYVHEARMKGGDVVPPCINTSGAGAVIRGKQIYLGFSMLHSLEDETVHRILLARERDGAFESLDDFIDRVPISVEQMDILIRIDAFRFLGKNKRALLWDARFKIDPNAHKRVMEQRDLFREPRKTYKLPDLSQSALEDAFDQIELLGFPLEDPFSLLEEPPTSKLLAADLKTYIGQEVCIYGYLVTRKDTSTVKGDRMAFGNFVDFRGEFIDTVHFPQVVKAYPFRGRGVYKIQGTVTEEFDCINVEVEKMERVNLIQDPRYNEKRVA
jgi:DNA polymerase-3 subunit alpha